MSPHAMCMAEDVSTRWLPWLVWHHLVDGTPQAHSCKHTGSQAKPEHQLAMQALRENQRLKEEVAEEHQRRQTAVDFLLGAHHTQ